MSLLIKGMDMPKPGDIIVVAQIDGRVQCTIASRHLPVKWREVVNIPTPHGRLIDADRLITRLKNTTGIAHKLDYDMFKHILSLIEHQLTIIEAEGES